MTNANKQSTSDGAAIMRMVRPEVERLCQVLDQENMPVGAIPVAMLALATRAITESAAFDRSTFLQTCAALWDANAAVSALLRENMN